MKNDITYFVIASYNGRDRDLEGRIIKAAKRSENGGGYDFMQGRSDVSFTFKKEDAAKKAAQRIKRLKIKTLRVDLHESTC